MAFKSVENDGGQMAEGDYEVLCVKAEEKVTKTGVPCVSFDFQVRSDVEQKYQRKHIFKSFFQDEEGAYDGRKIGKFANALGVRKDTEFELSDLVGLCCILHMRPYTGGDGVTRDSIYYSAPTKAGQMVTPGVSGTATPDGFVQVDDDDLPF